MIRTHKKHVWLTRIEITREPRENARENGLGASIENRGVSIQAVERRVFMTDAQKVLGTGPTARLIITRQCPESICSDDWTASSQDDSTPSSA